MTHPAKTNNNKTFTMCIKYLVRTSLLQTFKDMAYLLKSVFNHGGRVLRKFNENKEVDLSMKSSFLH